MEYDPDDPIPIESDYWSFWNPVAEDCIRLARHFGLLALLVALGFPHAAKAQVVGYGIVCDTPEQVRRYVLSDDAPAALNVINAEKAQSCALMKASFYVGKVDSTIVTKDSVWQITHILITGILTPGGMRPIEPTAHWIAVAVESKAA